MKKPNFFFNIFINNLIFSTCSKSAVCLHCFCRLFSSCIFQLFAANGNGVFHEMLSPHQSWVRIIAELYFKFMAMSQRFSTIHKKAKVWPSQRCSETPKRASPHTHIFESNWVCANYNECSGLYDELHLRFLTVALDRFWLFINDLLVLCVERNVAKLHFVCMCFVNFSFVSQNLVFTTFVDGRCWNGTSEMTHLLLLKCLRKVVRSLGWPSHKVAPSTWLSRKLEINIYLQNFEYLSQKMTQILIEKLLIT